MPHDLFISYSRRDLAAVKPIKEELEAKGFSCWMDLEGIESGSPEFTEKIAEAIGGAAAVLFFLSNASQESRWSLNELRLARDEGRHVVIVRFDGTKMFPKFKLEFGGADIIDWRSSEQKEKLLRDLTIWIQLQRPCYLSVLATLDGHEALGSKLSVDGLTMDLPCTMALSYGTVAGPLVTTFTQDGVQFISCKDRFHVNWHGTKTLVMPLERRDEASHEPHNNLEQTPAGYLLKVISSFFPDNNFSRNARLAGCLGLISLLSMFSSFFTVAGPLAAFFAIKAFLEMKRDPTKRGKGWAFLGLVIGSFVSFCTLFVCLGDA